MSTGLSPEPVDEQQQITLVAAYLDARDRKEQLAADAKAATKLADEAEQRVLDFYANHGVQSVRTNGRLVSLTRTLRARPKAGAEDDLIVGLHEEGYDDLVRERVSTSTLSAWVRERDEAGEPVPEGVMQYLEVAEMFGLSVRKG